jgi:hypothetical protein
MTLLAVFDGVVTAEYHCRGDWQRRHVTNIRDGMFDPTCYASAHSALIPFNPPMPLVLNRPPSGGVPHSSGLTHSATTPL